LQPDRCGNCENRARPQSNIPFSRIFARDGAQRHLRRSYCGVEGRLKGRAAGLALLILRKGCRPGEGASNTTNHSKKPPADISCGSYWMAERNYEADGPRSTLTRMSRFAPRGRAQIAPRDLSHGKMWERELRKSPATKSGRGVLGISPRREIHRCA
jgi:hypothetical protein